LRSWRDTSNTKEAEDAVREEKNDDGRDEDGEY